MQNAVNDRSYSVITRPVQSTALVRRPHSSQLAIETPMRQNEPRRKAQENHPASGEPGRDARSSRQSPSSSDLSTRSGLSHRQARQSRSVDSDMDDGDKSSQSTEARSGQVQHNKSRRTFNNMVSHGAQLNGDVLVDSAHLSRIQMDHKNCEAGKTGLQSNGCISEDNMRMLIENFNFGGRS